MKLAQNWHTLILSFLVLNLFDWIVWVEFRYGIPQVVKYVLSIFVLSVFLFYFFTKSTKEILNNQFRLIFLWFIVYSLILLVSSLLSFNQLIFIQRLFADRTFFIPYLMPILILFIRIDLKFFQLVIIYGFFFLPIVIISLLYILILAQSQTRWLEHFEFVNIFNICSNFLLLASHYTKKRYLQYSVILYYLLYILLALIYGRRGLVISGLLLIISMLYLRLRSPLITINRRTKIYLIGIASVFLFISLGYLLQSTYAFERGFSKAGFEQSRSAVFDDFFEDFKSPSDWIFGRGIEGRVFRSIKSEGSLDIIEQGYLTIILRGGLLYLIPFVLIFINGIYLGLFKSNNDLTKGLAIIALLHLALMFYFNLPDYSTYYIFTWIAVVSCFNAKIRNYSDVEIYKMINQ